MPDVPAALQARMVDDLAERGALRDERVRDAFLTVPRHLFLPGVDVQAVYQAELAIPTRHDADGMSTSSSSAPTIMAIMLEQLDVRPGHRVLEVGAGTAFNAALLRHLVGPDGEVTTVDIEPDVVAGAVANLSRAGVDDVRCITGDGWLGVEEAAPFDRVIVTVGVVDLSPAWVDQLRDGGRIVAPLWLRRGRQASIAFERENGHLRGRSVVPCGFMRLRGPHAGAACIRTAGTWELYIDDDMSSEELDTLAVLLAGSARDVPAPSLQDGWSTRLLLSEPGALLLTTWPLLAVGLLDASAGALALVVSERRATPERAELRGDTARARELLDGMARLVPLPIEALDVEAWPASDPGGPPAEWVLERPCFRFHLSAP